VHEQVKTHSGFVKRDVAKNAGFDYTRL